MLDLENMAALADSARKAKRAILARDARRLADEIESLCRQFQKLDALSAIQRTTFTVT
jgi:hypothetical protein